MRENRYTFYTGSDALSNRGSSNKSNHVIIKKISAINHVALSLLHSMQKRR